jgi:hypothetical protein
MAEASPKPSEVTEADLRKLPRWAIVALAARNARRVQPLVVAAWARAPKREIEAVDTAISIAESAARGEQVSFSAAADAAAATSTAVTFATRDEQFRRGIDPLNGVIAVYYIADAAAHAAQTAATTTCAAVAMQDGEPPKSSRAYFVATCGGYWPGDSVARYAARNCFAAASACANAATISADINGASAAARSDLAALIALAKANKWRDTSPVDVALLGPLWSPGNQPTWANAASCGDGATGAVR